MSMTEELASIEGGSRPPVDDVRKQAVRKKYEEAQRQAQKGQTLNALRDARTIAEAICAALQPAIPEPERRAYAKAKLHDWLGILERLSTNKSIDMPRAVIAALRTLQAFGNYASHHEPGAQQPPQRAIDSAMASLDLAVDWFLSATLDRVQPTNAAVPLRVSAYPGVLERWRILRATPTERPEIRFHGGEHRARYVTAVDPEAPAEARLAAILSHYAKLAAVCEAVCRAVLARETTLDVETKGLEELARDLRKLSEARPSRVPSTAVAAVDEIVRRRATVQEAIQAREQDIAVFELEAMQIDPTDGFVAWFELDYLGRTSVERHWKRIVFGPLLVYAVLWFTWTVGHDAGRGERTRELRETLCAPAGAPDAVSAFCAGTATKPSAGATPGR